MLQFMRNKTVGVEVMGPDELLAWGTLADDIYGVRLRVSFERPGGRIKDLTGEFDRFTTPECPKAIPLLQRAVGMDIYDPDFNRQVNKSVGRAACEHFASLLIDCAAAVRQQLLVLSWQEAQKEKGPISLAAFLSGGEESQAASAEASAPSRAAASPSQAAPAPVKLQAADGQMVIDLHMHSFPASACASDSIDDMLASAKAAGLTGVCLTDHNYQWDPAEAEALGKKHGLMVLTGCEITTVQGDILVFGFDRTVEGIPTAAELCQAVREAGGVSIAAHPFRGFRTVGAKDLGLTVEKASARPLFQMVDALEAANSKVSAEENQLAANVAAALGKPAVGGSDAHSAAEAGIFATSFDCVINNLADLIAAIKAGAGRPVAFAQQGE